MNDTQGVLLRYRGGEVYALPTADRHARITGSRAARRRLDAVIAAARAELLAAVAAEGAGAAASRLGVDVATLRRWRAPGGWLHAAEGDTG